MDKVFSNEMNVLKALAILLVVSGHLEFSLLGIFPPYSFQLALFFFISGCLFKDKYLNDVSAFVERRIKSLLVPYFWYNLFYLGVTCLIAKLTGKFWGMPVSLKNFFITPFLNGHQFDLSFYEQIEILRGMSNILQGVPDGQSLGGVINLVRKKAKSKFGLSTYTSAGSWKNYRSEIDLNIPLMKNNKLRSRWVFFLNNREFFYDRSNMNKQGGYGVVEWEVTPSTLFDLSYAYQYTRSNVLYNGLPALRQT